MSLDGKTVLITGATPRVGRSLALGAILAAEEGAPERPLEQIPAVRWGNLGEVGQALIFLLAGPAYITGEILHIDGGRHLV